MVPFKVSGSGSGLDVQDTLPLAPPPDQIELPPKEDFVLAEASPEKPVVPEDEKEEEEPEDLPPRKVLPRGLSKEKHPCRKVG